MHTLDVENPSNESNERGRRGTHNFPAPRETKHPCECLVPVLLTILFGAVLVGCVFKFMRPKSDSDLNSTTPLPPPVTTTTPLGPHPDKLIKWSMKRHDFVVSSAQSSLDAGHTRDTWFKAALACAGAANLSDVAVFIADEKPLEAGTNVSIQVPEWESFRHSMFKEFMDYDEAYHAYVDFAGNDLGGGLKVGQGGCGNTQEEDMVSKSSLIGVLGTVREELHHPNPHAAPVVFMTQNLFQGKTGYCPFNGNRNCGSAKPYYGIAAGSSFGGYGKFPDGGIDSVSAWLERARKGFSMALQLWEDSDGDSTPADFVIHTGGWGTGEWHVCDVVSLLVQARAFYSIPRHVHSWPGNLRNAKLKIHGLGEPFTYKNCCKKDFVNAKWWDDFFARTLDENVFVKEINALQCRR